MFNKRNTSSKLIYLGLVLCLIAPMYTSEVYSKVNHSSIPAVQELVLPSPTKQVSISRIKSDPVLKGIKINPKDPFKLEFIIDTESNKGISEEELSSLIKYFLAALTIPEEDLWVNLSPSGWVA